MSSSCPSSMPATPSSFPSSQRERLSPWSLLLRPITLVQSAGGGALARDHTGNATIKTHTIKDTMHAMPIHVGASTWRVPKPKPKTPVEALLDQGGVELYQYPGRALELASTCLSHVCSSMTCVPQSHTWTSRGTSILEM